MTTDKGERDTKQEQDHKPKATDRFDEDTHDDIPLVSKLPFGTEIGSATAYIELPVHVARTGPPKDAPRWRIEIHDIAPGVGPLGLDVLGDVVMGRGAGGPLAPDLDMDIYGGFERGVSRRHALLRPTINHLYVIDLGSTNGTLHNAVRLGPGVARALTHNDTLTLGKLTFTMKIVDGPGLQRRAAQAATPEAAPSTISPSEPGKTAPMIQPSPPVITPVKPEAGKATLKPPSAVVPQPEAKKAPATPTSSRPTVKPEEGPETGRLKEQTKPLLPEEVQSSAADKMKQVEKTPAATLLSEGKKPSETKAREAKPTEPPPTVPIPLPPAKPAEAKVPESKPEAAAPPPPEAKEPPPAKPPADEPAQAEEKGKPEPTSKPKDKAPGPPKEG